MKRAPGTTTAEKAAVPAPQASPFDAREGGEGVIVEEVEVVARRAQAEQELGAELVFELHVHVQAARALSREDVGQGQVDRHRVDGRRLAAGAPAPAARRRRGAGSGATRCSCG